jgi:magnesium transporter
MERSPRLPPDVARSGEPIPAGQGSTRSLRAVAWTGTELVELADVSSVREAARDPSVALWVDVPHDDPALLAELAPALGLHALIVEDIIEQNQRAKVELTEGVLHLVMFALRQDARLESDEIDIVLGERFLLTAHASGWDPYASYHFRIGVEPFLRGGPDYVLWAIVDGLVDSYFPLFDTISDEIDDLQDEVIRYGSRNPVERLLRMKRDLLEVRHALNPQREIFNQLTNRELPFVRPERIIYFRDVYDHLIRLTDELDSYRDMVGTTLDAYLTTVNNDLSEVMKRLTAVTVVVAGIGAIGGLFGMSEAPAALAGQEGLGFWLVIGVTLALAAIATLYFRRIGWL